MKKLFLVAFTLASLVSGCAVPAIATAANSCPTQSKQNQDPTKGPTVPDVQRQCDPALTSHDCSSTNISASNCDLIQNYIQPAVDLLSIAFGLGVVIAIIYGGIQYASSGGDPQKAASGKGRIRNAIVALVAYIFLWSLLNFLIPGGAF